MPRLLFICLGNVCRSPLAEAVFAKIAADLGVTGAFQPDSAGTNAYAAGSPPDPRMQKTARRHGIPMEHASRMFVTDDFDRFDLILAADRVNLERASRLARTGSDRKKIRLLRDYDPESPRGSDIPDPYYGGQDGFEQVYEMTVRACDGLIRALRSDS